MTKHEAEGTVPLVFVEGGDAHLGARKERPDGQSTGKQREATKPASHVIFLTMLRNSP